MRDVRSLFFALALASLYTGHAGASSFAVPSAGAGGHFSSAEHLWAGGAPALIQPAGTGLALVLPDGGPSGRGPGRPSGPIREVVAPVAASPGRDPGDARSTSAQALGRDGHPTTAPPSSS